MLIKGQDTRPLNGHNPEDIQTQPSILAILQSPDATGLPAPSLPLNLELPKEERGIPFYTPEEDSLTLLKAPSASAFLPPAADFNPQYPVPSQELQLPSLEPWNPNNDPKLYYELPAAVTKYEEPTNVYPKKYNKLVHEKDKPLGGRPKQEVNLIPISEQEYQNKQKNINKVLSNLAKAENQKLVETEKVRKLKLTSEKLKNKEPQAAATGFSHGFADQGGAHFSAPVHHEPHAPPAPNMREEFHMRGHDGPHSYKWGFDTGKG